MKILEQQLQPNPGGFGWAEYDRVRTIPDTQAIPKGATQVDDNSQEHDWQPAGTTPVAPFVPGTAATAVDGSAGDGATGAAAEAAK